MTETKSTTPPEVTILLQTAKLVSAKEEAEIRDLLEKLNREQSDRQDRQSASVARS